MSWFVLVLAGVFEVAWAVGLKQLQTAINPLTVGFTVGSFIASFVLLSMALKTLPLGTAYAIWTGVGAFGTFILGVTLFQEALTPARICCAALLIAGIVGLKFCTN